MDRELWIDTFVMELGKLGSHAVTNALIGVAERYYATYGMCDPSRIAQKRVEQFGLPGEEPATSAIRTMFGGNVRSLNEL